MPAKKRVVALFDLVRAFEAVPHRIVLGGSLAPSLFGHLFFDQRWPLTTHKELLACSCTPDTSEPKRYMFDAMAQVFACHRSSAGVGKCQRLWFNIGFSQKVFVFACGASVVTTYSRHFETLTTSAVSGLRTPPNHVDNNSSLISHT